jgi:hypothetical protein
MPSSPTRARDRLLRYRFETAAQAAKHLHSVAQQQLLFFPDPFLDVHEGQPVLLELTFGNSEQTMTVRGEVHSIAAGGLRGAWIELHALRLLDCLKTATGPPRRLHRRMPVDLMVRIERPGLRAAVARLADVSAGGARLVSTGGKWSSGEEIQIFELAGGPPLIGKVLRSREGEVAVQFVRADANTRRGALRLLEQALGRWSEARETHHPAACGCPNGGALLEPLLPKALHRFTQGT